MCEWKKTGAFILVLTAISCHQSDPGPAGPATYTTSPGVDSDTGDGARPLTSFATQMGGAGMAGTGGHAGGTGGAAGGAAPSAEQASAEGVK